MFGEKKFKKKCKEKIVKFILCLEFSKDIFLKTILSIFSFFILIYLFFRVLLNLKYGLTWREKTAYFFLTKSLNILSKRLKLSAGAKRRPAKQDVSSSLDNVLYYE